MRVKEFSPAKKSQIIENNDFGFQGKEKCGLHQCVFFNHRNDFGFWEKDICGLHQCDAWKKRLGKDHGFAIGSCLEDEFVETREEITMTSSNLFLT